MLLSAIEIIATILGIVYLYLEYKAKYALWIVGLFCLHAMCLCFGIKE
jgi:nicotinamide riboside transporter PnuC